MPAIFLSSTIRDLGDLRSAMKFWLEEQGFIVYASETPEFPYPLDRDAIAASLAPIQMSDYYVLLVGDRVGQQVKGEGISVTRAEFRRARETRRLTGKPHMLHLVRRSISESRRTGRPPGVSEEDWPAIVSFLDEITDGSEEGDPNVLREFDSFRDVVDVLRATLRVSGPLARRALEANLLWELKANTRQLLGRGDAGLRPHALLFPNDIHLPSRIDEAVEIGPSEAYWMFYFHLTLQHGLGQSALVESIDSGAFLDWDRSTSSYIVGPLQRALLELRRQLQTLDGIVRTISTSDTTATDTTELAEAARQQGPAHVTAFTARMLYGAWSATMNVLRLNRALYRVMNGLEESIQAPELTPTYAPDEESRMRDEEISEAEAETWLSSASWRLQSGDAEASR